MYMCVCKYTEASEQGCAVVKVCYLCSHVKSDWPFCHTPSAHLLPGVPVGKQFWKWKRALCDCNCSQCSRVSLRSPGGKQSTATMERTRDQHGAHLCSHPPYRQCLNFSVSFLMSIHLTFFNHSTQLGGQTLVSKRVPTHRGHPGFHPGLLVGSLDINVKKSHFPLCSV